MKFEDNQAIIIAAQTSKQPICVYGHPGCGKSRLINLAWQKKYPSLSITDSGPVSVNIDDSVDAKSFVGTFRSSLTEPGRFEWADGLLVDLIKTGRWLVLEDVDRLSADILSILPRQGDTHFRIPEVNQLIPIHADFGLIGTAACTTTNPTRKLTKSLSNWLLLHCEAPIDLLEILPLPRLVSQLVVSTYRGLESSKSTMVPPCERKFGLHDLFKVVARIQSKLPQLLITDTTTYITEYQKSQIGLEFLDIFIFHSPSVLRQSELKSIVEQCMECGPINVDSAPTYSSTETQIAIGGIVLDRVTIVSPPQWSGFTLTSIHLQLLHSMAKALIHRESLLFVGDTGTGKTTTVQFLARQLGVKLFVFNFSDQTEKSDLIGGLKPVLEIEKLVVECENLLKRTQDEANA